MLMEENEANAQGTDELPASPGAVWLQRRQRLAAAARKALPFFSGMLAALAAVLLYQFFTPDPQPLTLREVDTAVAAALAEATPLPAYSSLVYDIIRPALVLIEVQTPGEEEDAEDEDGLGTGVVINTDGDILTSLHVVTNTTDIRLTFADGTQSSGQVIATEPDSDIAVLRASQPPALLIPAVLGNPAAMHVGDEAFAVGHPFGLYGSMSTGIISGLNRTFRHPDSDQRLQGLMQIDAAVNPGNSGGPLLNRYGQVVGIVTGLVNPTDENFFVGIGFAVPIDVAGGAAGLPPY